MHSKTNRYSALDGLRGIAASVVVAFHFVGCFSPQTSPNYSSNLPRWVDTPLGLIINGQVAVAIFFVLSGFVLASASSRVAVPLWLSISTRWVRLAGPATVSILFACALLHLFPNASISLDKLIPSPWHAYVYTGSIPGPVDALVEGLYQIFIQIPEPASFNNVLWTMKFEFIGSIAIYVLYSAAPERWRALALALLSAVIIVIPLPMPYLGFAFGAGAFELSRRGISVSPTAARVLFAAGVVLAFPGQGFVGRWHGSSLPSILRPGELTSLTAPLSAFMIVVGLLHMPALSKLLESRIPAFLGKVSFPLYLVHVPIIFTVVSAVVSRFILISTWQLSVVFVGFFALSLGVSWILEVFVDAPLLEAIRSFKRSVSATDRVKTTAQ